MALPDTKNATWKNDKSRFGYKILSKFGWTEEKGLGKDETGSIASIAVAKREDALGLGAEKMTDGAGARGWHETTSGFNAVLDALKSEYGTSSKKSKKSSKEKHEKKKSRKEKRSPSPSRGKGDDTEPIAITVGIK